MGRRRFALSNMRVDLDLLQVNKKKTETPVKIGKANEQMIYREETLKANQHNEMLRYIIIRNTQVEKNVITLYILDWQKLEHWILTSVGGKCQILE